ncbi:MAG: BPTI/Kunitz-type proteinase inhibitor domain-containing protein [Limnoraphis robusta]|uniref:BPTI/Kunitz-type proteinase inhibitor domain-containing protein n=1 Tax=Limnoraphis robusta CCNP1315 TaxID=3110306 RepID=A0ABU5TY98_9CYAN|nr:BPTI/Kunitz-type proteinase inhibitor domain-containing protein [Limnoraphis robusta]MEA5519760.1 BPTI/Kunitz-type proteinase inhibitor domain-containing protein [Limnoraphis robusta CCNP1315]MEA5547414.1 BPTI/Kunitz-type proteinase inhibitor domain-containing protein [Limnoraphis robusta CCNP1324]
MKKQTIWLITKIFIAIAIVIFNVALFPQTVFAQQKTICNQPIETGSCRASFNRYAFNGSECVQFSFGGCEGNENNFITLGDCQQTCLGEASAVKPEVSTAEEICAQRIESGSCQADFNRYAFNGSECVTFSFGGCEGNENNFITLEDCQETCVVPPQK